MHEIGEGYKASCQSIADATVWYVDLDPPTPLLLQFEATLSDDEKLRACRCRFDWLRRRFVTARGVLRHLLSRQLAIPADQITFSYTAHGKPKVDQGPLHFSVSHSHECAAIAVSGTAPVGMDLEFRGGGMNDMSIARHYFSPLEVDYLAGLDAPAQHLEFLRLWTIREAYLKATGLGLGHSSRIEVNTGPLGCHTLHDRKSHSPLHGWDIHCCDPSPGYTATLVRQLAGAGPWRAGASEHQAR